MTEGFSPWQAHQVLFLQETGTFASSSARGPALCCSTWRGGERGQRCPQSRESRVLISHEPRGGALPFRGRIFSMLALLHLAAWFTCFQRSYWRCSRCLRALHHLSGQGNVSGAKEEMQEPGLSQAASSLPLGLQVLL